jgi:hypothetical protein
MIDIKTSQTLFGDTFNSEVAVNRNQLADFLFSLFKDISLEKLVSLLTNDFEEALEYVRLVSGELRGCQKTSLLFNPHRLDVKTKSSKRSLFAALHDAKFVNGLSRALLWRKLDLKNVLYYTLQSGIEGVQYVNEFPPHVARDLCKMFKLSLDSEVLDPCAGWGGRMPGCSAVVNHYTACEPSSQTHAGLLKLRSFIQAYRHDFEAALLMRCFEDVKMKDEQFDFALTSPPYFDTEEYCDEETNSLNKFKTFKDWVDGFYYPLIDKTMRALRPGSTFVLNIGSRVYPLNKLLLDKYSKKFEIEKLADMMQTKGGLRTHGEGESFYAVRKA